ncbi:MOSC domain-containing protein [Paenibacillus pasadenensis]|uniref:MOSC domain-containing protein n=1 Tax=Paenibacillus pasadenensis TaxID=217090 RepID=UPI00203EE2D5|nr:MOSC N-terminal beta barrel domain-containing protein [Paenibacillus pasadenensis]MCM3749775.1 MOSC domain-containing protein [Paenibacillus pasadenensis]
MRIGQTEAIWRYPVKSMGGERLEHVDVESYGLLGDRFCSFYDETKQGWNSYFTARKYPQLLGYRASYVDGSVRIQSPTGKNSGWDEKLRDELEQVTGVRMSMNAEGAPGRAENELKSVDAASILIATDATLRRLEQIWGKKTDVRRFRPNLLVRADDPLLDDSTLLGSRLRIGSTLLQVDTFCERCVMITYDPDSLERDPSLLKTVHQSFGLRFGLYASVLEPGMIAAGDEVLLVSE